VSSELAPTSGGESIVVDGGGFVKIKQLVWVPDNLVNPMIVQTSRFTTRSASQIELTTPPLLTGSYELYVCGAYSCGSSGPNDEVSNDTVTATQLGEAVVTSAGAIGGGSAMGSLAGGTTFEVQGTNFGPLNQIAVDFVNGPGATVASTAAVSPGPAPTDPGATETILVQTPPAPGGTPGIYNVVIAGADGTSPVNNGAEFGFAYP
jgi:hypothetical protein